MSLRNLLAYVRGDKSKKKDTQTVEQAKVELPIIPLYNFNLETWEQAPVTLKIIVCDFPLWVFYTSIYSTIMKWINLVQLMREVSN